MTIQKHASVKLKKMPRMLFSTSVDTTTDASSILLHCGCTAVVIVLSTPNTAFKSSNVRATD